VGAGQTRTSARLAAPDYRWPNDRRDWHRGMSVLELVPSPDCHERAWPTRERRSV